MVEWFHISSSRNRESIQRHGLDWRRMGAARGIAGSDTPEQEGCFLIERHGVDYFVEMNNTSGPVDVWAVREVDESALVESPEGYRYLPARIPPQRLTLVRRDVTPVDRFAETDRGRPHGFITVFIREGLEPDK
jgi:hypothetical protein